MRRIGALTLAILFKECKYWDANGDGTITEEEYIGQVRNIMK